VPRERLDGAVADRERRPVGEATLGGQRSSLLDRAAGQVDPADAVGAALQRREGEVAGPAPHVEHGPAFESLTIEGLDQPAGDRGTHPALASPRGAVHRPLVEAAGLELFLLVPVHGCSLLLRARSGKRTTLRRCDG
jgi:hypothetical protein